MDATAELQHQLESARAGGQPVVIRGGGSRRLPSVLADHSSPFPLELARHHGVVDYLPEELVLTARAGTPLCTLEAVLAEQGQVLPFEPAQGSTASTLGGAVATGLSGPARPWWGSTRDAVLGIRLLDGRGQVGRFGGQVMKNVAGYDVARLNVGAWGGLGVLLDISLRLRPAPETSVTLVQDCSLDQALERMLALGARALPLTGLAWTDGQLLLRLAGTDIGVTSAARELGGEPLAAATEFWCGLRDQRHPALAGPEPVYRLSLPADAPLPDWRARWLLDWGGAQRWCATGVPVERVHAYARQAGGWAMQWWPEPAWPALPPTLLALHRRIRKAFDPDNLLPPLIWDR